MKRVVLGLSCFAVLCMLAYYSSRLYSDSYYEERRWSLEAEPEAQAEGLVRGKNGSGGAGMESGGLGNALHVAGNADEPGSSSAGREAGVLPGQGASLESQLREASLPPDQVQPEIPLGENGEVYKYYLIEEFGFINIYCDDLETVYEYTEIEMKDLPQELQDEISRGKGVLNEQELFDFLENYSS